MIDKGGESVSKRWVTTACLAVLLPCLPASAAPTDSSVPVELRQACGKPGSQARITRFVDKPLVVRHRDCDLSGVTLIGLMAGVQVPRLPGGAQASGRGPGYEEVVTVQVVRRTRDVTALFRLMT